LPEAFGNIVYTNILGLHANVLTLLVLYLLAWAYLNFSSRIRFGYMERMNRSSPGEFSGPVC
jgi:ribose transport system permease protein